MASGPGSRPGSEAGGKFNFAFYDCMPVGGGEYKLVPKRPRKMVPISYAAKLKGISVQTIHNYIIADFLKTVERPTPCKWLIDLGEIDALLEQTTDMEFWTPERKAAYLKAKHRPARKARPRKKAGKPAAKGRAAKK
ncbi:hypothetical protein [Verrucomicrobium sp. GAS474]|uniref:hypothetical protein n=1 Tax=Verrucomicrobium sp. GAS474 TaxID=1882831 RepID=UPI000B8313F6|nr:hypothetical protein [Verrucomicrobium sp. GAS474]